MWHLKRQQLMAHFRWAAAWASVWVLLNVQSVSAEELIAVIKSLDAKPYEDALQGFKEAFVATGYQPSIEEYTLKEGGQDENILADVEHRRPALILTLGSAATAVIHARVKDVPVVFCMVLNPVASGFVQSMQSSGNNLTGASLDIPAKLQFEALRAVVPSIKKVGVLYNARETGEVVGAAAKAAAEEGLELVARPVSSVEEVPEALDTLKRRVDALWSVADSTVFSSDRSVEFLLRRTLQSRLPLMGLSPAFVQAGALLALSVDYRDVGAQCGEQAARVLAGQAPASLPITTPRKVTLYLNLNVARAIGVEVPPRIMQGAVVLR